MFITTASGCNIQASNWKSSYLHFNFHALISFHVSTRLGATKNYKHNQMKSAWVVSHGVAQYTSMSSFWEYRFISCQLCLYLKEEKILHALCARTAELMYTACCVFEWAYRWPCVWKIACCWSMDSKPAVFASLSSTVSVCTVHTVQHTQSIVCRSIQLTVCFSHLFIMPFIISSLHQLLSAFLEKY